MCILKWSACCYPNKPVRTSHDFQKSFVPSRESLFKSDPFSGGMPFLIMKLQLGNYGYTADGSTNTAARLESFRLIMEKKMETTT